MRKKLRLILLLLFVFFLGSLCTWLAQNREKGDVAVVRIEGGIFDSEPTIRQLEDLEKDRHVKAVVLRVDSPGGSVSASQEIYDAVKALREKKKVVVSMGTVAASGGYYVSLPADKILANPGTVTGSIGVRMELVNLEDLVSWAHLKPEVLKSGNLKDIGSPFRPMTDEERSLLQAILHQMHEQFKAAVGSARGLTPEEVNQLADGRIFTGEQAVERKLIDGLGSLKDAIQVAGKLAGLENPEPFYPRKEKGTFIERILESSLRQMVGRVLERQWRPLYD